MDVTFSQTSPIGIFDSGVGGLSVLRKVRELLPIESIIYIADQEHVPYGRRERDEVQKFARGITNFLLSQGVKIIVVACNTASAAALHSLRNEFPEISFVGMEPAVKPAAESSATRKVGVLATPATFQGELYASVVERFAKDVTLFQHTCPGLVEAIENGEVSSARTRNILEDALHPMMEKGIDTIVLGCTHYPFVIPLIEEITGGKIRVIDPAPAVARQVERILEKGNLLNHNLNENGKVIFFTSGDPSQLIRPMDNLLGLKGDVLPIHWDRAEQEICF